MRHRKDKINFLKGLLNGSRYLKEIQPENLLINISSKGTTYTNIRTGKVLSEDEISEYFSKKPKTLK